MSAREAAPVAEALARQSSGRCPRRSGGHAGAASNDLGEAGAGDGEAALAATEDAGEAEVAVALDVPGSLPS